jgi:hypothetical protein
MEKQCPTTDDGVEEFYKALQSTACGTCPCNQECDYTYKDVSWADAIGGAGGYVALVDSFFTMIIIIIYLTCTGQPPAAVVWSPVLSLTFSRHLIMLVCPRDNADYRVAVTA